MNFDGWIDGYKVTVFPWIDREHIYVKVQYFKPGASLAQPPAMEKTAFIADNENGRNMVKNYLSTLVHYIARSKIETGKRMYITAENFPLSLAR